MPHDVPVLTTERLRLRAHTLADLPLCAAMWTDPEVMRFIGGESLSQQQTWARMCSYLGHWSLLGFGFWALEERASGQFIGELGFADFKRDMDPALGGLPEAGWVLARAAQGRGYAREALRAALAWGDKALPAERSFCIIDLENERSLKVAGAVGYSIAQQATYRGKTLHLLFRPRQAG
jgi:RimJ/RimL family protein N-acetyltransferase